MQYEDDEGFFDNVANENDDLGAEETYVARAAFVYTPTDDLGVVLRLETGDTDVDDPINQNTALFTGQDVGLDNEGLQDIELDSATVQLDYHVNFGDGTITNIFGWRHVKNSAAADLDSQPTAFGFDFLSLLDQDQLSNELGYTGSFCDERWSVTADVYYFTQDVLYRENRVLTLINETVLDGTFGANQDQSTRGIFTSNEIARTESLKLNLGVCYAEGEKDVETARFIPSPVGTPETCSLTTSACLWEFENDETWSNISPKTGLDWQLNHDAKLYVSWSKGFRSGGFSLRYSTPLASGLSDEEEQTAFELGFDADWLDGRLRTNGTFFTPPSDGVCAALKADDRTSTEAAEWMVE